MASGGIHVKVSGALQAHIQQQIGHDRLYENASEYIRALVRRDLQTGNEAWDALQKELAPRCEPLTANLSLSAPRMLSVATSAASHGDLSILSSRRCSAGQDVARHI